MQLERVRHQPALIGPNRNVPHNRWLTRNKFLIAAGTVTVLAIATFKAIDWYTWYKNGQIKNVDCHVGETIDGITRDFTYYYKKTTEQGKATDQFCLAKLYETGNGVDKSLSEARNLYKKAYEQGLKRPAYKSLCHNPDLFEHKWETWDEMFASEIADEYSQQFKDICCPCRPCGWFEQPHMVSYHCPWEKPNADGDYLIHFSCHY